MGNLDFGSAFSRVFELYGKHAVPLLIWSAVFQGALALVIALFAVSILAGGGLALLLTPLIIALSLVASALMTGAYVAGLDQANRTGTFPGFGEVWPLVTPRLGALVGTSLLAALGVFLGIIALVIPGLILMTWWAVAAPVVVLENQSGTSALGRSRELVKGNGWTVFGLIIVTGILTSVAGGIIGGIIGSILGGSDTLLGSFGSQFVSGTLVAPISALLGIVIYEALTGTAAGPGGDVPPAQGYDAPPATQGYQAPPATPGTQPPTTPPPADSGHQGPFV
jgi:uncharacterized membrane protein